MKVKNLKVQENEAHDDGEDDDCEFLDSRVNDLRSLVYHYIGRKRS